jgi:hypothetical protein
VTRLTKFSEQTFKQIITDKNIAHSYDRKNFRAPNIEEALEYIRNAKNHIGYK